MIKKINQIWWISLVIGILFLSFGIVALANTSLVVSAVVFMAGILFLFLGIKEILTCYELKQRNGWWSYLIYGILSLSIGIAFILNPSLSIDILVIYLGAWALLRGLSQVVLGYKINIFRRSITSSGMFLIIFGFIMLVYPSLISGLIIIILGILSIIFGIFQIVTSSFVKDIVNKNSKIIDR